MMVTHTTLEKPISFKGVGIHSGEVVSLNLVPKETPGWVFVRTDLDNAEVPVSPETLSEANRATWLKTDVAAIATPEHLLAALFGMGITALRIEIDGEEVPILDGSASVFVEKLRLGKRNPLSEGIQPIRIEEPLVVTNDKGAQLMVEPSDHLQYSFTLEHPETFIGTQEATFDTTTQAFDVDVAPARTFGFLSEVESLRKLGLARGGSYDNTLVILDKGYSSPLRLKNELAVHKILDMIGDLAILGRPIIGHVKGLRSGHAMNIEMVKLISKTL